MITRRTAAFSSAVALAGAAITGLAVSGATNTATATEANTAALAETAALADAYSVDTVHSGVTFKIDRVGIPFNGRFDDFDGAFTLDLENPEASTFNATIQIASVSTANADRDKHLRAADMFNARQFPTAEFQSTSVRATGTAGVWEIAGDMTFMGVTQPVTAQMTYHGTKTIFGKEGAGFTADFAIKRSEFGFTKYVDQANPEGGALADTVYITIDVTGIKG